MTFTEIALSVVIAELALILVQRKEPKVHISHKPMEYKLDYEKLESEKSPKTLKKRVSNAKQKAVKAKNSPKRIKLSREELKKQVVKERSADRVKAQEGRR